MASAMESPSSQSIHMIRSIKNSHDEAFLYIDQGLSCDETQQTEQAMHLYCKGLKCIDKANETYRQAQRASLCSGEEWKKVHQMLNKMSQTRSQIQTRVDALMRSDDAVLRSIDDPPPSYEDSLTPDIIDGGEVDESLQLQNARCIFSIMEGVQIFFISAEGYVSAPSYPSALGIFCLDEPSQGSAPAFIKVGSWVYPLLPGRSPALHSSYGAFMFPDVNSSQEGASVGIIIPDSVSSGDKDQLEELLHTLTDYREQPLTEAIVPYSDDNVAQQGARKSERIASGIVTVASWLAKGISKGAEKADGWLQKGSVSLRNKLQPEQQPSHIEPSTQKGMEIAAVATGTAVKVTSFVVTSIGKGTAALCRQLAPHARRGSEKILPESFTKKGRDGNSILDDCCVVAHGGLKGFGTLHIALEKAAVNLGQRLKLESTNVIQHKYGEDAGKLAGNAVGTGVNTVLTVGMVSNIGCRALARTTAKQYARQEATRDAVPEEDDAENRAREEEEKYLQQQTHKSLYPPGTNPRNTER